MRRRQTPRNLAALLAIAAVLFACGAAPAPTRAPGAGPAGPAPRDRLLRYVALGDSYTIGASVRPWERWPAQLL